MSVSIPLTDEVLDELADRVAERLTGRHRQIEDRWLRGGVAIAEYIGAKPSRVYALSSAGRIPVEHDGSALIARCSDLDKWVRDGGGIRP